MSRDLVIYFTTRIAKSPAITLSRFPCSPLIRAARMSHVNFWIVDPPAPTEVVARRAPLGDGFTSVGRSLRDVGCSKDESSP